MTRVVRAFEPFQRLFHVLRSGYTRGMERIDAQDLMARVAAQGRAGRHVTAIVGPPGSGKSTVAEQLADALNAAEPGSAAVLPMDGFHFDDMVLEPRGWRPRKGAPHTFDVAGYAHMLRRLRANDEPEIAVPVFDRDIEIARAGARMIPREVRHLITEGNYLLLDREPWSGLAPLFDTSVFLEVPLRVIEDRLARRWQDLEPEAFREKMEGNDLPNARLVLDASRRADFVLQNA